MDAKKLVAALREVVNDSNAAIRPPKWEDAFVHLANILDRTDQPAPAPAPDVVREALEAWIEPYRGWSVAELAKRTDTATRRRIEQSLAALDAAPAEPETLGYAVVWTGNDGFACSRVYASASEAAGSVANTASPCRIVRLVAEKEPR